MLEHIHNIRQLCAVSLNRIVDCLFTHSVDKETPVRESTCDLTPPTASVSASLFTCETDADLVFLKYHGERFILNHVSTSHF